MVLEKEDANWIIGRGRDKMLVKMEGGRIVDIDTDFAIKAFLVVFHSWQINNLQLMLAQNDYSSTRFPGWCIFL